MRIMQSVGIGYKDNIVDTMNFIGRGKESIFIFAVAVSAYLVSSSPLSLFHNCLYLQIVFFIFRFNIAQKNIIFLCSSYDSDFHSAARLGIILGEFFCVQRIPNKIDIVYCRGIPFPILFMRVRTAEANHRSIGSTRNH